MPRSLRGRVLITLTIGLVAMLGLQALLAYRSTRGQLDRMFDLQMLQVAQAISRGMPHALADVPDIEDDGFDLHVRRYRVAGREGARFSASPLQTVTSGGRRVRRVWIDDHGMRTEVTQDIDARREVAADVALASLGAPAIAGGLLLGGLLALLARLLAPLQRLRGDVASRSPDDLAPLAIDGLPAELEPVVAELNRLLGRVEEAFATQRRFVADAAHELRTPLAALVLQTDVVEHADNEVERHAALVRLRAGLSRSARVADQLLDLARADALRISTAPARSPIELLPFVSQMLGERAIAMQTKSLTATVDVPATALVLADRHDLHIVLANLLDNAVAYTPHGGAVHVAWREHAPFWRLSVEDTGPGIPAADKGNVRRRFYRVAGTSTPGSGLGLAIAEEILHRNRAELELDTSPLGGLAATVVWPRA